MTVLMGHVAITSMAAACVSQASADHSALRGCALTEPLAYTVNTAASVNANALSGEDLCSSVGTVFLILKNIFNVSYKPTNIVTLQTYVEWLALAMDGSGPIAKLVSLRLCISFKHEGLFLASNPCVIILNIQDIFI